jgi:nitroreductase
MFDELYRSRRNKLPQGGMLMNAIFERVSIRKYQNKPVEKEKLDQLMKAAMAAPSAGNQQPWEFYIITDRELLKRLADVSPYSGCMANAAAAIVPCYYSSGLPLQEYAQIDCSIASENILLEAVNLGLGAVWLGIAPEEERMQQVEKILNIPAELTAFSLISCGYPAESRRQQDRYDGKRVHII